MVTSTCRHTPTIYGGTIRTPVSTRNIVSLELDKTGIHPPLFDSCCLVSPRDTWRHSIASGGKNNSYKGSESATYDYKPRKKINTRQLWVGRAAPPAHRETASHRFGSFGGVRRQERVGMVEVD